MTFDAFISYSSKDKTAADAACAVLEGAGIRCWVAPRDIRPGGEYGAAIIEAIEQSRVMVLIFSSSANDSRQIRREIERAVSKGIPIVPVRIEDVVPTKSMEYFLGSIHWLDALTQPIERHLRHLAVTVKAILAVDASAVGSAAEVNVHTHSTAGPDRESDRSPPHYGTAAMRAGADRTDSKTFARASWFLPALGGGILVAVLAGGAWLYQSGALVPVGTPKGALPQPASKQAEALVPETVPFIADRDRVTIRSAYLSAPDHKALAISLTQIGFLSGQKDDETAKSAALENCQRITDAGATGQRCELYAIGNSVVYKRGRPPMPPEPWLVRNPRVERPFSAKDVPLVNDNSRAALAKSYAERGNYTKALAISQRGATAFFRKQPSPEEAMRRALEACGSGGGIPCLVIAVDDNFVVPIPTTMKVTGIFHAAGSAALAPEMSEDVARRLGNAASGWNVVAVGSGGRPALALNAENEQLAIDIAMANCSKQDRNCRVIAIGPFSVESQN